MILSLKNISAKASTALLISMIGARHCLAGNVFGPTPDTGGGGGNGNIEDVGIRIINAVLNLIGIIAVLVIVIAGVRLIIGGADDGQREKARSAIIYAIIGLILVLFAGAIVQFIADKFQT